MNWIIGWLTGSDVLHKMFFSIWVFSGDVRISYTLVVIFSIPVPDPNALWCISYAGNKISWTISDGAFISSLSKSKQVQISPIFFFRTFLNVNLGLISTKKLIFASIYDWNLFSLMNTKLSRRVSKIPVVSSCLEPNFNCVWVYVDSNLKDMYIHFVTALVLMAGNICSYALPDGIYLLYMTLVLSEVMMTVESSIVLIASNIHWWTVAGYIIESFITGRISGVQRPVKRSLSTTAMVAWAVRRFRILFLVFKF